jgi:hypothetical protein
VALTAAGTAGQAAPWVDLRFAGTTVRYTSPRPEPIRWIAEEHAGAVPQRRGSPDLVVEVGPGADLEKLHRSVPDSRADVWVTDARSGRRSPGSADLPVLPPLQADAFAGRHCALHAALIEGPWGAVVVCGERRAGKSTTALTAQRLGLGSVLTDELVVLDRTGDAWGVPLPIRERTASGRPSRPLSPTAVGATPVRVAHVVVLTPREKGHGEGSVVPMSTGGDALRLVSPHIRPLDTTLGEATCMVLELLRRAETSAWSVRPWPDLAIDLEAGLRSLMGP